MTIEQAELIDEALGFLLDQSYDREEGFEEQIQAAADAAYASVKNTECEKENDE